MNVVVVVALLLFAALATASPIGVPSSQAACWREDRVSSSASRFTVTDAHTLTLPAGSTDDAYDGNAHSRFSTTVDLRKYTGTLAGQHLRVSAPNDNGCAELVVRLEAPDGAAAATLAVQTNNSHVVVLLDTPTWSPGGGEQFAPGLDLPRASPASELLLAYPAAGLAFEAHVVLTYNGATEAFGISVELTSAPGGAVSAQRTTVNRAFASDYYVLSFATSTCDGVSSSSYPMTVDELFFRANDEATDDRRPFTALCSDWLRGDSSSSIASRFLNNDCLHWQNAIDRASASPVAGDKSAYDISLAGLEVGRVSSVSFSSHKLFARSLYSDTNATVSATFEPLNFADQQAPAYPYPRHNVQFSFGVALQDVDRHRWFARYVTVSVPWAGTGTESPSWRRYLVDSEATASMDFRPVLEASDFTDGRQIAFPYFLNRNVTGTWTSFTPFTLSVALTEVAATWTDVPVDNGQLNLVVFMHRDTNCEDVNSLSVRLSNVRTDFDGGNDASVRSLHRRCNYYPGEFSADDADTSLLGDIMHGRLSVGSGSDSTATAAGSTLTLTLGDATSNPAAALVTDAGEHPVFYRHPATGFVRVLPPDADHDGVRDEADLCPNVNDRNDADSDGVPGNGDGCDMCKDGDDYADADSDSVPDACDRCEGFDDLADDDNDDVPNGCDICADFDNADNADGDDNAPGCASGCDQCCGLLIFTNNTDGFSQPWGDENQDYDGDGRVGDFNACEASPGQCPGLVNGLSVRLHDLRREPGQAVETATGYSRPNITDRAAGDCDLCADFDDTNDLDGDAVPGRWADTSSDGIGDADTGCDWCGGADDLCDADSDGRFGDCDADSNGVMGDGVCCVAGGSCEPSTTTDLGTSTAAGGRCHYTDAALASCQGTSTGLAQPAMFNVSTEECGGGGSGVFSQALEYTLCDRCEWGDDSIDCDVNSVPDACDIEYGYADPAGNEHTDCNSNGVPDYCDGITDCNSNSINDLCELATNDCDSDSILDLCQDCNSDGFNDRCQTGIVSATTGACVSGDGDGCDATNSTNITYTVTFESSFVFPSVGLGGMPSPSPPPTPLPPYWVKADQIAADDVNGIMIDSDFPPGSVNLNCIGDESDVEILLDSRNEIFLSLSGSGSGLVSLDQFQYSGSVISHPGDPISSLPWNADLTNGQGVAMGDTAPSGAVEFRIRIKDSAPISCPSDEALFNNFDSAPPTFIYPVCLYAQQGFPERCIFNSLASFDSCGV